MMFSLLLGTASFVPMAASDWCYLNKRRCAGLLFLTGCAMLIFATLRLLLETGVKRTGGVCGVFTVMAFASVLLLLYSVFWAVRPGPKERMACPADKQPLISRGMYALCRHPGVLWLGAFYGFMAIARGSLSWLLAFLLFTGGDTLYVLYQDRRIFPHTIDHYAEYQKHTPFLIPTASSMKEALAAFGQRERS